MPQFCNEFNDKTKAQAGKTIPVIITAFEDKSFSFIIKTRPAGTEGRKKQDYSHKVLH